MTYLISKNKNACTGCGACADICPKKCIHMVADEETFLYPVKDETLCIDCHMCEHVCPLNFTGFIQKDSVKAYVGRHNSESVLYASSSGGAFSAICSAAFDSGVEKVYGTAYRGLKAEVVEASTEKDCEQFRKAKYFQNDPAGCYTKILEDIKCGRSVFFASTPCEIAALKSFLREKSISEDGLLSVALLCHGVPSQKLFEKYVEEASTESRHGAIFNFTFRSKQKVTGSVNSRTANVTFEDGYVQYATRKNNAYLQGYYGRLFYRPSCGMCIFARQERLADLTIGDAWNADKLLPEVKPIEGWSLVLSGTKKGKEYIERIKKWMDLTEVPSEWALQSQDIFIHPTVFHPNRELFFQLLPEYGFRRAVKKAMHVPLYRRVINKLYKIAKYKKRGEQ